MNIFTEIPQISDTGWTLVSAEDRHRMNPDTFIIPDISERSNLQVVQAVRLLFDIESRENNEVFHRGVDRMWVLVAKTLKEGYLGVLDNSPGIAENLRLDREDIIYFEAIHVSLIDQPPENYMTEVYAKSLAAILD